MGLLVGANPTFDEFVAAVQVWAGQVDGINAAERLAELTGSVAGIPTVKPGTIHAFAGVTVPTGYLLCNGAAVSRTTYAALFAVLGVTWGSGDGVSTFNLPDGRGRYFLGQASSGTGSTIGGTFGTIDHVHSGPSHTHTVPAHTHPIDDDSNSFVVVDGGATFSVSSVGHDHDGETGSDGAGTTGASGTGNTGTANPPTFVGQWIIKT